MMIHQASIIHLLSGSGKRREKGGDGIGYSGHKHQKGEKERQRVGFGAKSGPPHPAHWYDLSFCINVISNPIRILVSGGKLIKSHWLR